jgi:hypothetical protein
MTPFSKAVLINVAIAVALTYEYFKGTSLLVIAISAVVLFSVANIAMWLKSRNITNKATQAK